MDSIIAVQWLVAHNGDNFIMILCLVFLIDLSVTKHIFFVSHPTILMHSFLSFRSYAQGYVIALAIRALQHHRCSSGASYHSLLSRSLFLWNAGVFPAGFPVSRAVSRSRQLFSDLLSAKSLRFRSRSSTLPPDLNILGLRQSTAASRLHFFLPFRFGAVYFVPGFLGFHAARAGSTNAIGASPRSTFHRHADSTFVCDSSSAADNAIGKLRHFIDVVGLPNGARGTMCAR